MIKWVFYFIGVITIIVANSLISELIGIGLITFLLTKGNTKRKGVKRLTGRDLRR